MRSSRMVMLVVDDSHKETLEAALERAGVEGYTELHATAGRGRTGPRLGSRGYPGTSAVVFSVLDDGEAESLRLRLMSLGDDPAVHLRAYSWPVDALDFSR